MLIKEKQRRKEMWRDIVSLCPLDYGNGFLLSNYEAGYDDGIKRAGKYRSRDEAWNAWETLKDDRTVKSEKRITKRKAKEMCIYDRERNEYRYFL